MKPDHYTRNHKFCCFCAKSHFVFGGSEGPGYKCLTHDFHMTVDQNLTHNCNDWEDDKLERGFDKPT